MIDTLIISKVVIVVLNTAVLLHIVKEATDFYQHLKIKQIEFSEYIVEGDVPKFLKRIILRFFQERIRPKDYYKLFKYMHLQATGGAKVDEILSSLYRASSGKLSEKLMRIGAYSKQTGLMVRIPSELQKLSFEPLFITCVRTIIESGLDSNVLNRLDEMYFKTYLNEIRKYSKKIKIMYFVSVVVMVIAIGIAVLMPMIYEMLGSLRAVFG